MLEWRELGRAVAPDGGTLILRERNGEFVIRVDGNELMSSRVHGSEEAMAELALAGRRDCRRVLIGGLGLGYTLRATLDAVGPQTRVVVAEIVPAVVEWNRTCLAHLAGRPLEDPRVEILTEDVGRVLRTTRERFDAILLDVDNGPDALTRRGNQGLYSPPGLDTAKRALRPGGTLAVWSASPDPGFASRLARVGLTVSIREVPARGAGGGPKHSIFLATLPALPIGGG